MDDDEIYNCENMNSGELEIIFKLLQFLILLDI